MNTSIFEFLEDNILEQNISITFDHIQDLILFLRNKEINAKKNSDVAKSSIRKTTFIYTISIIESLLLWKIRACVASDRVSMRTQKFYNEMKVIHRISPHKEVVSGILEKKKEMKKLKDLSFADINEVLKREKIIGKSLFAKLEDSRKLRNKIHIGSLEEVDQEYSDEVVDFGFETLNQVILLCRGK